MIVGADAPRPHHSRHQRQSLRLLPAEARLLFRLQPDPRRQPRSASGAPPLLREHRLYQADWLMRFYGFDVGEIVDDSAMLPLDIDPKLAWALRHRDRFPLDVNRASREELLRVPGFGTKAVDRIIATRRTDHDPPRRSRAAARAPQQGAAIHRPQRSPALAASPRWRTADRTVQAEGNTTGIWLLKMHVHHHPRQRNRFRRLAQSRAQPRAESTCKPSDVDLDRARRATRSCSRRRAPSPMRRAERRAPSTSRQNSSSSRRPRSCIATPSALRSSIACCGG